MARKRLTKNARAILEAARASLARPRGWCQGTLGSVRSLEKTPHCAVGALLAASYKLGFQTNHPYSVSLTDAKPVRDAHKALLAALPEGHEHRNTLVWFNDGYKTRKKDVLALYDRALGVTD